MTLKVNEIFGPTIQGEGKTTGKKVMFLRLSGCNLHCDWCDTPHTWNWVGTPFKHPDKYERTKEERKMSHWYIIKDLRGIGGDEVKALVISGGEPLLQQKKLFWLLKDLKELGWWIEIETNGTIPLDDELQEFIDQVNCSPKLSNSGNCERIRIRKKAMENLVANPKSTFKFVVSSQEDVEEIEDYVNRFAIPKSKIYLMPLGKTPSELAKTEDSTKALAKRLGVNYSDRAHVKLFGGKRGV